MRWIARRDEPHRPDVADVRARRERGHRGHLSATHRRREIVRGDLKQVWDARQQGDRVYLAGQGDEDRLLPAHPAIVRVLVARTRVGERHPPVEQLTAGLDIQP